MVPDAPTPSLYRKELSFPTAPVDARNKLSVVPCFFKRNLVTKITLSEPLLSEYQTIPQFQVSQMCCRCAVGTGQVACPCPRSASSISPSQIASLSSTSDLDNHSSHRST